MVRAGETGTCVLGIESSCDDTGAAVVTADGRVLGESLASQGAIHAPWGGVVPKLAQGAHEEAIDRVVQEALDAAGVAPSDLDAIAVTVGPGLSLCLRVSTYASRRSPASDGINPNPLHCISRDLVGRHAAHTLRRYCTDQTLTRGSGAGTQGGVLKARMIAAEHRVPLIPIHHMEAHTLVARLEAEAPFPFLGLLVSGGHNLLVVVRGVGDYTIVGGTLDDALGEAYDKVARMLGLDVGGGGGQAVEQLALEGDANSLPLPVPMVRGMWCVVGSLP